MILAAAEGDAYGKQDGGGNGAAYLANALVSAAAAAVFILSPETVRFCASPLTLVCFLRRLLAGLACLLAGCWLASLAAVSRALLGMVLVSSPPSPVERPCNSPNRRSTKV